VSYHGWELGKALKFLRASNPGFVEWLLSPRCYLDRADFRAQAMSLATPNYIAAQKAFTNHHLAIAMKHYKLHIEGHDNGVRWKK
jgi:predicted nucleotidyltransferase